jgi:8-oxo-dGTP pyrophosphatase MutT (NUDIX family)
MTDPAQQDSPAAIRRTREILAYSNRFVRIYDDEVTFSDGSPGRYLRIASAAEGMGVVILPIRDGQIGMVRVYRYPVGEWEWGLPRGFSQDPDPLTTAHNELHEELGARARCLRTLGYFAPDSGLLAQRVAVVLAEIDHPGGKPEDTNEVADTRWLSVAAMWTEVAQGRVWDGMTLAALAIASSAGAL